MTRTDDDRLASGGWADERGSPGRGAFRSGLRSGFGEIDPPERRRPKGRFGGLGGLRQFGGVESAGKFDQLFQVVEFLKKNGHFQERETRLMKNMNSELRSTVIHVFSS